MDSTDNPGDMPKSDAQPDQPSTTRKRRKWLFIATILVTAAATFGIAMLLSNIFMHKEEAKNPYLRFVDVNEITTDPEQWGKNWPRQYDGYLRTADVTSTKYGGAQGGSGRLAAESPGSRPLAEANVRGLCVRDRLQRAARACLHAI